MYNTNRACSRHLQTSKGIIYYCKTKHCKNTFQREKMAAAIAKHVNNNSNHNNNNQQLKKWHSSELKSVINFNLNYSLPDRYLSNYKGYSHADEVHIGTKKFLLKHFTSQYDSNGCTYTRQIDVDLPHKELTDAQLILKEYFKVIAEVTCKKMKECESHRLHASSRVNNGGSSSSSRSPDSEQQTQLNDDDNSSDDDEGDDDGFVDGGNETPLEWVSVTQNNMKPPEAWFASLDYTDIKTLKNIQVVDNVVWVAYISVTRHATPDKVAAYMFNMSKKMQKKKVYSLKDILTFILDYIFPQLNHYASSYIKNGEKCRVLMDLWMIWKKINVQPFDYLDDTLYDTDIFYHSFEAAWFDFYRKENNTLEIKELHEVRDKSGNIIYEKREKKQQQQIEGKELRNAVKPQIILKF